MRIKEKANYLMWMLLGSGCLYVVYIFHTEIFGMDCIYEDGLLTVYLIVSMIAFFIIGLSLLINSIYFLIIENKEYTLISTV